MLTSIGCIYERGELVGIVLRWDSFFWKFYRSSMMESRRCLNEIRTLSREGFVSGSVWRWRSSRMLWWWRKRYEWASHTVAMTDLKILSRWETATVELHNFLRNRGKQKCRLSLNVSDVLKGHFELCTHFL